MDSPHFTGHITVTAVAALLAQVTHQLELFIVLWNTCGWDVPKSSESMHCPQTNKNHKQIFKQHFKESPFRSREKSIAQHFALWPSDDEISSSPVSLHYLVAFLPPACWALWTRYTYSSEHPGVRLSTKNGTNKKSPNQVQIDDGRPTNSISHIRSRFPDSKSKLNQPAQECDYRAVIHTGERERVQSVYGAEKGLF